MAHIIQTIQKLVSRKKMVQIAIPARNSHMPAEESVKPSGTAKQAKISVKPFGTAKQSVKSAGTNKPVKNSAKAKAAEKSAKFKQPDKTAKPKAEGKNYDKASKNKTAIEKSQAVLEAAAERSQAVLEAAAERSQAVLEAAAEKSHAVLEATAEKLQPVLEAAEVPHLLSTNIRKKEEKNMKKQVCFTNRELSWLQFNERVLNEAGNPRVPLAERLTFASIYQTNLDEFFMVRVGAHMMQMQADEEIRDNKTGMTSAEQVAAILKRVKELEGKRALIYEQLMGELEPHGIRIINFNKLSKEEGDYLEEYFDHYIAPFLSPMIIGKQQPFPFLNNRGLYAVVLLNTKNGKNKTGILACTNSVFKRLIAIPGRPGNYMLCEELILHFVSKLYQKYTVKEKSLMRVTRNADIDAADMYDEDLDYRDMMEHLVKRRTRLSPVRLEITHDINAKAKAELAKYLNIDISHIIKVNTPLDLSFVFTLQGNLRDKTELFYEKRSPQLPACLNYKENILAQVAKKDVLLSYPFESMKPFLKLLHEAAEDPTVVSIKMTLYRVADRSKIIEALVEAAENGKEVVVLVELRARFDESNNIEMSRRLEDAGCQIIYGLGQYKVHSKLCLITRNLPEGISYITQIGTGNYNEKTSRLYTDLSLITSDFEIGTEAAEVFQSLMMGDTVEETRHLLVAPNCLQNKVVAMIDEEIAKVKAGGEGYIGFKINSLTDKVIIQKIVEASQAGVKAELIIRGICCLKPGVLGYTDNVTVVSVVGRFLEHSRIYRFGKGEGERVYIASADFMTRNTIRRVEVAAPVYDDALRARLTGIFDTIMKDDEKGKEQNSEGLYVDRNMNEEKLNSQELFYAEAYEALVKTGQTEIIENA